MGRVDAIRTINTSTVGSCRGCWWQEGGRCYVGEPERDERGVSKEWAIKACDKFYSKRKIYGVRK